jgi:hypothetical protein
MLTPTAHVAPIALCPSQVGSVLIQSATEDTKLHEGSICAHNAVNEYNRDLSPTDPPQRPSATIQCRAHSRGGELILPEVSHFALLQDPLQFNEALLHFLSHPHAQDGEKGAALDRYESPAGAVKNETAVTTDSVRNYP